MLFTGMTPSLSVHQTSHISSVENNRFVLFFALKFCSVIVTYQTHNPGIGFKGSVFLFIYFNDNIILISFNLTDKNVQHFTFK